MRSVRMACMDTFAATFEAMAEKAWAAGESGAATTTGAPSSPPLRTRVSMGTSPRSATLRSLAISDPPPRPKISVR